MTITLDTAFKMVKQLNEKIVELRKIRYQRQFFISEESKVEDERPVFDLIENANEIMATTKKLIALKHAINEFNSSFYITIDDEHITIDSALVYLSVLSSEKMPLADLRFAEETVRANSRVASGTVIVEYKYRNFSANDAKKLYDEIDKKIIQIQSALNLVNVTQEIEVDI